MLFFTRRAIERSLGTLQNKQYSVGYEESTGEEILPFLSEVFQLNVTKSRTLFAVR
jgi:hypothetical protein